MQIESKSTRILIWFHLCELSVQKCVSVHNDIIEWKHSMIYWPFVRGIHWSPVDFPHKGQWCGALIFSLICTWTIGWANIRDTSDLSRHHAYYDVTVMNSNLWTETKCASSVHMFLCIFWFDTGSFYLCLSGLLHWHWGSHMIAPVLVKEPWKIWAITSLRQSDADMHQ